MTDTTELAQRMSIERIKQIALGSTPTMGERESLAITALHFAEELKIATDAFQAAGLAQLAAEEALEKAQETIAFQQGEIKALLSSLESRTVTVKLPRPGFITISGERMAVYLKGDVDAEMLAAGIEEAE